MMLEKDGLPGSYETMSLNASKARVDLTFSGEEAPKLGGNCTH